MSNAVIRTVSNGNKQPPQSPFGEQPYPTVSELLNAPRAVFFAFASITSKKTLECLLRETIAQMNLFFREKREEINESIAEMRQTVVDLKRAFVETTPGVETSWKSEIVDGIKESMRELTVGTSAPNIAESADSARARVSPAQESRPADDKAVRIRSLPEPCGLMNEMMKIDKEEDQKLLDHMEVEGKILDWEFQLREEQEQCWLP